MREEKDDEREEKGGKKVPTDNRAGGCRVYRATTINQSVTIIRQNYNSKR